LRFDEYTAGLHERYEAKKPSHLPLFKQGSKIRVPLTMWVVDGVWVRTMRTVFGQIPVMRVIDENPMVPPEPLPLEVMLQHLTEQDLQLRMRSGHLFLNAYIEGTGIAKVVRDERKRTVRERRSPVGRFFLGDELVERDVVDRAGLGLEVIDLKDFLVGNPAIVDINDQPWVGHRVWHRWDAIVRRQRDGIYTLTREELAKFKGAGKIRQQTTDSSLDSVKRDLDRTEESGWADNTEYELWEVFARYDVNGDGLEEEVLLTISPDWNEQPLRSQYAPYWNGCRPYIAYRPKPRSNRFYGRSLAAEIQPLQDEADARINQDLDATTISVLAALTPILPLSAKRAWETHRFKLLEPIYSDVPEQFRTLSQAIGQIRQTDPQLDRIFVLAERVSGMSDPQTGRPSEGSKTAFEINTVVQEGNIKFAEYIEQLQLSNTELGYQVIEHAYQLAQESSAFAERIQAIVGKDPFADLSTSTIRRRVAVRPVGNTIVSNKEQEARRVMNAYAFLKDDQFVNADPKRAWRLRAEVLKKSLGFERDYELFIGNEADLDKMQGQQLLQRALAGDANARMQLLMMLEQAQQKAGAQPEMMGVGNGAELGQAGGTPGMA